MRDEKNMRLVFDTNVLISAAFFSKGIPCAILDAVDVQKHQLLFSEQTFQELHDVLLRPQFDRFDSNHARVRFLRYLRSQVTWIEVTSNLTVIDNDLPDNDILAVALDGNADYLVTGNTKHFMHPSVQEALPDCTICTPREFYDAVVKT